MNAFISAHLTEILLAVVILCPVLSAAAKATAKSHPVLSTILDTLARIAPFDLARTQILERLFGARGAEVLDELVLKANAPPTPPEKVAPAVPPAPGGTS